MQKRNSARNEVEINKKVHPITYEKRETNAKKK